MTIFWTVLMVFMWGVMLGPVLFHFGLELLPVGLSMLVGALIGVPFGILFGRMEKTGVSAYESSKISKEVTKGVFDSFRSKKYNTLQDAAQNGDFAEVKRLILNGADVNERDHTDGETPLHCAVKGKNPDVISFMLDNGAKPNVHRDGFGTPLRIAVMNEDISVIEALLNKGVNPNWSSNIVTEDFYGKIIESSMFSLPLFEAVVIGNQQIVELLLKHGADPTIRSTQQQISPLEKVTDNSPIKELLLEAASKIPSKQKDNEKTENVNKQLEDNITKTSDALMKLPIGNYDHVKIILSEEIAEKWGLPLKEGNLETTLAFHKKCFEKDMKNGSYFDIRQRQDIDYTKQATFLCIQCSRAYHFIGRTENDHYIWVLHA